MSKRPAPSILDAPLSGLLSWLLPGLGHIYLGHRRRGVIFLVTITLTYWTGVAVGGVRGTVSPREQTAWFVAQMCAGGNTLACLAFRTFTGEPPAERPSSPFFNDGPYLGHWQSIDIGIVYTAVAGLLTILVILDAIVRADQALMNPRSRPSPDRFPSS